MGCLGRVLDSGQTSPGSWSNSASQWHGAPSYDVPSTPSCCLNRSTVFGPFHSLLLLGQVRGVWSELGHQEGWGRWRLLGDLQDQLGYPGADLLSPFLLQNTDLFEMIEKMQVRWALEPVLESHRRGWTGGGGPLLYLQPYISLRTGRELSQTVPGGDVGSVLSRALCLGMGTDGAQLPD